VARKDSPDLELTLIPAYGRDYKTSAEVIKAWNNGRDFQIATVSSAWHGSYANKEDAEGFTGTHCKIRFNRLRDTILINVKTGEIVTDDEGEE